MALDAPSNVIALFGRSAGWVHVCLGCLELLALLEGRIGQLLLLTLHNVVNLDQFLWLLFALLIFRLGLFLDWLLLF